MRGTTWGSAKGRSGGRGRLVVLGAGLGRALGGLAVLVHAVELLLELDEFLLEGAVDELVVAAHGRHDGERELVVLGDADLEVVGQPLRHHVHDVRVVQPLGLRPDAVDARLEVLHGQRLANIAPGGSSVMHDGYLFASRPLEYGL